jgi:hypothetical protein
MLQQTHRHTLSKSCIKKTIEKATRVYFCSFHTDHHRKGKKGGLLKKKNELVVSCCFALRSSAHSSWVLCSSWCHIYLVLAESWVRQEQALHCSAISILFSLSPLSWYPGVFSSLQNGRQSLFVQLQHNKSLHRTTSQYIYA